MRARTRGNEHDIRNRKTWLAAIIALHLIFGLVYWSCTPYGVAPDEAYHGQYVRSLVENHRLPVFNPSDRENYEAHQPPLYYALGVPFYLGAKLLGATDPGVGVRLLSLILGALSILVTYATIRALVPRRKSTALACAGFVALLPMHLALSSSVGNDILTELVFGVAILLMVRLLQDSHTSHLSLGLVLGLGLLTKTTCVLLFLPAILTYIMLLRRRALTAKMAGGGAGIMLGASLMVGGWWLARNALLYGDPFALSIFNQAFAHTAKPDYFLVGQGMSLPLYIVLVAEYTLWSFWGVFGHMKVFMPVWIYLILLLTGLVALVGSVRPLISLGRESRGSRDALIVIGTVAVLVLASFVRFNLSFFQAQGRYLYPAIIPIALTFVLGIERLLPERNRRWSAAVVNGGMLLLSLAALVTTVIPDLPYHQP